jgi:hypothetical protein
MLISSVFADMYRLCFFLSCFFFCVFLSSANFVSKGQGLPAANLKGVEVREDHKSDAWREEREQETQSNREKESKEEL